MKLKISGRAGLPKSDDLDVSQRGGRQTRWRGSSNHRAKLVEQEVLTIRERYAAGGVTMRELGEEYGVRQPSIFHIIHRHHWIHI